MVAITIDVNGEKYVFSKESLPINQFHYIRIPEKGTIEITAEDEIFVGEPIKIESEEDSVKLVMKIFVDGLSYHFLEELGLEKAMPNTYEFFKKGFISANCNSTNEWTLPSVAGINTGMMQVTTKCYIPTMHILYPKNIKC